jgi:hypothetical protein
MRSGPATSFAEDFAWQERFYDHFREIARLACQVDVASPEDDRKRNTDFILTPRIYRPPIRFSARARRAEKQGQSDRISIRLGRSSGAKTEMEKMLAEGYGDMLIYGFESNPGSRRLFPWLLGDLAILRKHIHDDGPYEIVPHKDDTTVAAYFYLYQTPPEFIVERSVMTDRMILEVMTTSPEITLCIAQRAGLPVRPVEKSLYRLAGMKDKYSELRPGTLVVFHPSDKPGKPHRWSLPDCYCEC